MRNQKLTFSKLGDFSSGSLASMESSTQFEWIVQFFPIIALVVVVLFLVFKGKGKLKNPQKRSKHRPNRSHSNELGSGNLATTSHIKRWLKANDEADTKLFVHDVKGGDGIALKQGELIVPREERNRHMLIIAKTGSGKTTRMILPILIQDCLSPIRSTIVIDSKPEMWEKLAGLTRKFNPKKKILLFNPLDTLRSLSWNILSKVETDTDSKLIANTIIMATDNPSAKADSPFFRNNALSLLNALMVGLLKDPNDRLSMPRIHELVQSGMGNLCDWLEARPDAIRTSRTFVDLARSGSQNADTIMSEMSMRLHAWDLAAIRSTTAFDELDLESLIAEPTLMIVELRESELEMLRPMANVIVVEILRYLTKRAESFKGGCLPRPISLVIDEFASALGRLPDIHVKLNTLRSRNVSVVAAVQSIAQIKANYDRDGDSVLSGFSTKIFMPSLDYVDAEWASKESGTMTVRFTVTSEGKSRRMIDFFANKNDNVNEQVQQRPVLTPDEIGRPADDIATIFLPNTPPFQAHLIPFFKLRDMRAKVESGQMESFSLRQTPIEYQDSAPITPISGASNNADEMNKAIVEFKHGSLEFHSAPAEAQQLWNQWQSSAEKNPSILYQFCSAIHERQATLSDVYQAFLDGGKATDMQQILNSLDAHLYKERLLKLGIKYAPMNVQQWWTDFEKVNEADKHIIFAFARELIKRNASITEFYQAYETSGFSTIPQVLDLLDAKRAKEQPKPVHVSPRATNTYTSPPAPLEKTPSTVTSSQAHHGETSQTVALISEPIPNLGEEISKQNGIQQNGHASALMSAESLEPQALNNQIEQIRTRTPEEEAQRKQFLEKARALIGENRLRDFQLLLQLGKEEEILDNSDVETLMLLARQHGASA